MKPPTILLMFRQSSDTHWVDDTDSKNFKHWCYRKGDSVQVHMATTHVAGFLNGMTQATVCHAANRSSTALIPTEHISIVRLNTANLSTGN